MFNPEKSNASENKDGENSRRNFIKKGILASIGLAVSKSFFSEALGGNSIENTEKPKIIARKDWDDAGGELIAQYSKKLGEKFTVNINGSILEKTVDILPYLDENTFERKELKDVLKRFVIHHSDIDADNSISSVDQAKTIRDEEVVKRNFNDVAYNFIIATNGTILEGRPLLRVGANAGKTKESGQYLKKHLPGIVEDIINSKGDKYYENLRHYIRAMKMDPDYGTVGVVLSGNFDVGNSPSDEQMESLKKLLNWAKSEYEIPTDNIILHKEVKEKVIEASGLTFDGLETVCPGKSFPARSEITNNLLPDKPYAKYKKIILEKFT